MTDKIGLPTYQYGFFSSLGTILNTPGLSVFSGQNRVYCLRVSTTKGFGTFEIRDNMQVATFHERRFVSESEFGY